MDDFFPREYATTQERANEFIAANVVCMQQLYSEAVLMAKEFDIKLHINLELPEGAQGGHNHGLYGFWNSSSQYC
ncbi:MAG: hypothetical protein ACXW1D_00190 [Halobacteriota archaeon]